MQLLGNRVLLQPINTPEVSAGGILRPAQYQADTVQFTVMAVGPGRRKHGVCIPPEVRVGDRCLCHAARGSQATLEDGSIIVDASQVEMLWPPPTPTTTRTATR